MHTLLLSRIFIFRYQIKDSYYQMNNLSLTLYLSTFHIPLLNSSLFTIVFENRPKQLDWQWWALRSGFRKAQSFYHGFGNYNLKKDQTFPWYLWTCNMIYSKGVLGKMTVKEIFFFYFYILIYLKISLFHFVSHSLVVLINHISMHTYSIFIKKPISLYSW